MTRLHTSTPKPSTLLALCCLALVHRLRPDWVTVHVREAADSEGISAERISRLATRALDVFEVALAQLTQKGRPPRHKADLGDEVAIAQALLGIATAVLGQVSRHTSVSRAFIVGGWLRLQQSHPLVTQTRFCEVLGLSARTFRNWLTSPPAKPLLSAPAEAPRPPKPRRRPVRRGRFGFDVTLPGTQIAADTTDLRAFGVSLKLIATQDIGGRDADLLTSVIVDDHESAELVAEVLTEALQDRDGAQAITDQGTPYLAEITRNALDELEVEHAPQREGDPLGKATLERAFGTVKSFARPLLALTDRIAEALPALRRADIAKATAKLVVTALLRAYQAGARASARATEARAGVDVDALTRAAEQSRERSRADDRSARLLLEHIHAAYEIDGQKQVFVRRLRRFALPVLREAERAFGRQAHRDDIKKRASYFAAIVRACNDEFVKQCAKKRAAEQTRERMREEQRRAEQQVAEHRKNPTAWLHGALEILAAQWQPDKRMLLFGGVGGRAPLRGALRRLLELHPLADASAIALGALFAFEQTWRDRIGADGVQAVRNILERELDAHTTDRATVKFADREAGDIINPGPAKRPEPLDRLRT